MCDFYLMLHQKLGNGITISIPSGMQRLKYIFVSKLATLLKDGNNGLKSRNAIIDVKQAFIRFV